MAKSLLELQVKVYSLRNRLRKLSDGEDGQWVTMRGRKVFIRSGENAQDALDRSLKYDKGKEKADAYGSGSLPGTSGHSGMVGEGRSIVEKHAGEKIDPELSKVIGNKTGTVKRLNGDYRKKLSDDLTSAGFKKMSGRTGNQDLYSKGKETISVTAKKFAGGKSTLVEIVKEH